MSSVQMVTGWRRFITWRWYWWKAFFWIRGCDGKVTVGTMEVSDELAAKIAPEYLVTPAQGQHDCARCVNLRDCVPDRKCHGFRGFNDEVPEYDGVAERRRIADQYIESLRSGPPSNRTSRTRQRPR